MHCIYMYILYISHGLIKQKSVLLQMTSEIPLYEVSGLVRLNSSYRTFNKGRVVGWNKFPASHLYCSIKHLISGLFRSQSALPLAPCTVTTASSTTAEFPPLQSPTILIPSPCPSAHTSDPNIPNTIPSTSHSAMNHPSLVAKVQPFSTTLLRELETHPLADNFFYG